MKRLHATALFLTLLGGAALFATRSSDFGSAGRTPASLYNNSTTPRGLTGEDLADYHHLSEGSDIYPYAWLMHLQSALHPGVGAAFLDGLDRKFNVLPDSSPGTYPLPWIGMGAAWSDEDPVRTDVKLEAVIDSHELEKVRTLSSGKRSIAMVGVNCAFCHTGQFNDQGKPHLIEGAPNLVDLRAFFQDLAGSTVAMLIQEETLEEFLKQFHYEGNARADAHAVSEAFKQELGIEPKTWPRKDLNRIVTKIWKDLSPKSFENVLEKKLKKALFQRRDVTEKYLTTLLKMTYGFRNDDEIPQTLKLRMKWFANLIGEDPDLETTHEGYGRTDAFGRISNWVVRQNHPIPLTAPVSIPSIWAIQYRDVFHWNGNTNSVVLRNIGQSFGLGAILTNPETADSTSNLENLHKLEELAYQIPVPNWTETFGGKVDLSAARRGCTIYQARCAKCHEPRSEHIGPSTQLAAYRLPSVARVGTDRTYLDNQAQPVGNQPFHIALFSFVEKIRARYYEANATSAQTQEQWQNSKLRGEEVFLDTARPKVGYPARHLSGVWASPPYLHNGSVPSIWDLLHPTSQRPRSFSIHSREYDQQKLGLADDGTDRFDVTQKGNSNTGHEGDAYGTNLSDVERTQLIEFLKILPPESEYSWVSKPPGEEIYENGKCR